jgi:ribose transport system permease protein
MAESAAALVERDARPRTSIGELVERSGIPLLLLALIVFFSLSSETGEAFRSSANLQNIFANQSVTGLIALGMVIPLVAGYFDLSVPAIAGLANVTVAAVAGTHHQSLLIGLLAGLGVAVLAGAINGLLIAVVRLNPFVYTLGVYILIGGLLQFYTKGQTIGSDLPASFGAWGSEKFLGIARPFWLLMVVALLTWYLCTQTPFGRKLQAIGSNETAARLAGFRVDRAVFITFVLSGLLGGIAGALLTSRSGAADPTTGTSFLFPAIAAVFLGQTAIRPGRYNVWGTMLGVFLVAVAVNGFTLMGAEAWVTQVFNGAALVGAIAFSTLMARNRDRQARAAVLHAAQPGAGSPREQRASRAVKAGGG